ncbi:unnamed protein product [Urochloa humidicola]
MTSGDFFSPAVAVTPRKNSILSAVCFLLHPHCSIVRICCLNSRNSTLLVLHQDYCRIRRGCLVLLTAGCNCPVDVPLVTATSDAL